MAIATRRTEEPAEVCTTDPPRQFRPMTALLSLTRSRTQRAAVPWVPHRRPHGYHGVVRRDAGRLADGPYEIVAQQRNSHFMKAHLELGLDTFGDVTRGDDGQLLPQARVIRDVVAEAVLADELGIDFIGVGEHHRPDFAVSAPEVVLAAIAGQTKRIRLGSAVTVLGSDDPIRVFQRFSTLDAVSSGRAEVILGRGSFTESFPLFGLDLERYEVLFNEKLDLFAAVRSGQPVTWSGKTRTALTDQAVYPPVENGLLRTWIGVGGTPQSVIRAASYGFGLMLAIIGGNPARFAPFVDLYHRALAELGRERLPIGV